MKNPTHILYERALKLICNEWGLTRKEAVAWLNDDDGDFPDYPEDVELKSSALLGNYVQVKQSTFYPYPSAREMADIGAKELSEFYIGACPRHIREMAVTRPTPTKVGDRIRVCVDGSNADRDLDNMEDGTHWNAYVDSYVYFVQALANSGEPIIRSASSVACTVKSWITVR